MTRFELDALHAEFQQRKYFPVLDGLRCLSVIAVIWHHSGHHTGLLGRGPFAVSLFFAISGFLITTLLLREESRNGQISLRDFYLRRVLRIFPLYYAVTGLYCLVVLVFERHTQPGTQFFANLPAFLTYTSNWFVDFNSGNRVIFYFAWSLATEEQFYLFWPSVIRFARRWRQPILVMIGLLLADQLAEWAIALGWLDEGPLPIRILVSVSTPICMGCLGAYLLHRPAGFRIAYRLAGQIWSAPLAAAALLLSLALSGTPTFLIHFFMAYLVLTVCIRPSTALNPVLGNRVFRYIGTISYGMYLLHMLAMNLGRRLVGSRSSTILFLTSLALTIGLASLSYRYFETPFLKLKERLKGRAVSERTKPKSSPSCSAPDAKTKAA